MSGEEVAGIAAGEGDISVVPVGRAGRSLRPGNAKLGLLRFERGGAGNRMGRTRTFCDNTWTKV